MTTLAEQLHGMIPTSGDQPMATRFRTIVRDSRPVKWRKGFADQDWRFVES
jgi:hypothetical protein